MGLIVDMIFTQPVDLRVPLDPTFLTVLMIGDKDTDGLIGRVRAPARRSKPNFGPLSGCWR